MLLALLLLYRMHDTFPTSWLVSNIATQVTHFAVAVN
jgi:hypothetical protein